MNEVDDGALYVGGVTGRGTMPPMYYAGFGPMGPMGPAGPMAGSMVTCCRTFYQPPGSYKTQESENRGDQQAAASGGGGGPGNPGEICFQEPLMPPLYRMKHMKLQKLLFPFLMKKHMLFG